MVRPRLCRRVNFEPNVTYFKPRGVPLFGLEESILTIEEFEAVRLKDLEGLEQEECAKKMNISQPTFHRLVLSARKKIADALVSGKAIKIEGGNYKMPNSNETGVGGIGRGFGRRAGGPPMVCVCPKCGYKIEHKIGTPCSTLKCPKCNISLTRG